MDTTPVADKDRSRDWKNGYQRGAADTRAKIWSAVYDYVWRHDKDKARDLHEAVKAVTEPHGREIAMSE